MQYRIVKFAALSFIPLLFLISCEEAEEENNERYRQLAVETLQLEPQLFEEYIQVTGEVEALDDAVVATEAGGRVQQIARRGTEVQEGEVISSLDDELLQANVESAQANYELARETYERQEPLLADSIITSLDFSSTRAQLTQARSQLNQAERQLRNADLEAPFNGRVEERMVKSGELVGEGTPVVRLVNTETVQVNAGIAERYIDDIREGTPVQLDFRSYGDYFIEGEVTYAGSVVDPDNRTFPIEIELENTGGQLRPDMMANINVMRSTQEDAIVVPRTAVFLDLDGRNVFVVNRDEDPPAAEIRRVEVGPSSAGQLLITDGLEEGDEIVTVGHRNLNEGDRLQILQRHDEVEDAIETGDGN